MALQAQQLPSFSFTFTTPTLRTLRLSRPLKSPAPSSSRCFVHSHSQFDIPRRRRRRNPVAHTPDLFVEEQGNEGDGEDSVGRWGEPASPFYGAEDDTDGEGAGVSEDEEELQESGEDDKQGGEEVGEWDPPVSPFRAQRREEPHYQEEEGEEEDDDDDGGGCEWLDPASFLPSQEGVSGACSTTTTAAMEEILAFARSSAAAAAGESPAFTDFLAGYRHGDLSEGACVELMRRMSEEGLALGCADLFRWLREKQPVKVSPQVWLAGIVVLGWCRMADEVLEIVARLPSEREFREAVVYNAAMSAVAYCGRYDGAWEIFELMEKNNVQPDHRTSSIMLNIMKKTKASAKDAWEFFQRMDRKGVS
ncbi:unnamed protein product [Urochloa humidicola]